MASGAVFERAIRSGLFSPEFYVRHAGDEFVPVTPEDAWRHFSTVGWRAFRDPSPWFRVRHYIESCPDFDSSEVNDRLDPLSHYLTSGPENRGYPHPLFSESHYTQLCEVPSDETPLEHFVTSPVDSLRDPHPLFSLRVFSGQLDTAAPSENPLFRYLTDRATWKLSTHELFDGDFYRTTNRCIPLECSPLEHFVTSGIAEGRKSHPNAPRVPSDYRLRLDPVSAKSVRPIVNAMNRHAAAEWTRAVMRYPEIQREGVPIPVVTGRGGLVTAGVEERLGSIVTALRNNSTTLQFIAHRGIPLSGEYPVVWIRSPYDSSKAEVDPFTLWDEPREVPDLVEQLRVILNLSKPETLIVDTSPFNTELLLRYGAMMKRSMRIVLSVSVWRSSSIDLKKVLPLIDAIERDEKSSPAESLEGTILQA